MTKETEEKKQMECVELVWILTSKWRGGGKEGGWEEWKEQDLIK